MKEYDCRNPLADIELSHVVKMCREAAELNPKRKARCQYVKGVHNLQPMCIVGHAFHALGVPLDWLQEHNNDVGILELFEEEFKATGRRLTQEEQRDLGWLAEVQHKQDGSCSWKQAVQQADAWVGRGDAYAKRYEL